MTDINRREIILSRLEAVLADIPGIKEVFRNRIDIPEAKRPAIVILDADESATQLTDGRGRSVAFAPLLCEMTPEIYIMGASAAPDGNVGSVLNDLRIAVIKAITSDQTLIETTKDSDITYLGFATGLASGRSIEGEAGISFQFRYLVYPTKL